MIAQDIIHSASHGRQKMPKQIGLGMTLRHLIGFKQIITLLNRMGHCSSYDDVEVADTSLALEVIAQSEDKGVVLPSNIVPGIFVQTAVDNNDINEQTLDGRQTTHSTTLVLYQKGQLGSKPKSTVYADHSATKKALSDSDYPHVMKEFTIHGKKTSFLIDKIQKDWYKYDSSMCEGALNMDLAGLLCKCALLSYFM